MFGFLNGILGGLAGGSGNREGGSSNMFDPNFLSRAFGTRGSSSGGAQMGGFMNMFNALGTQPERDDEDEENNTNKDTFGLGGVMGTLSAFIQAIIAPFAGMFQMITGMFQSSGGKQFMRGFGVDVDASEDTLNKFPKEYADAYKLAYTNLSKDVRADFATKLEKIASNSKLTEQERKLRLRGLIGEMAQGLQDKTSVAKKLNTFLMRSLQEEGSLMKDEARLAELIRKARKEHDLKFRVSGEVDSYAKELRSLRAQRAQVKEDIQKYREKLTSREEELRENGADVDADPRVAFYRVRLTRLTRHDTNIGGSIDNIQRMSRDDISWNSAEHIEHSLDTRRVLLEHAFSREIARNRETLVSLQSLRNNFAGDDVSTRKIQQHISRTQQRTTILERRLSRFLRDWNAAGAVDFAAKKEIESSYRSRLQYSIHSGAESEAVRIQLEAELMQRENTVDEGFANTKAHRGAAASFAQRLAQVERSLSGVAKKAKKEADLEAEIARVNARLATMGADDAARAELESEKQALEAKHLDARIRHESSVDRVVEVGDALSALRQRHTRVSKELQDKLAKLIAKKPNIVAEKDEVLRQQADLDAKHQALLSHLGREVDIDATGTATISARVHANAMPRSLCAQRVSLNAELEPKLREADTKTARLTAIDRELALAATTDERAAVLNAERTRIEAWFQQVRQQQENLAAVDDKITEVLEVLESYNKAGSKLRAPEVAVDSLGADADGLSEDAALAGATTAARIASLHAREEAASAVAQRAGKALDAISGMRDSLEPLAEDIENALKARRRQRVNVPVPAAAV